MSKAKNKKVVLKRRSFPALGLAVRTGSFAGHHKNKGLRSVGPERKRKHKTKELQNA